MARSPAKKQQRIGQKAKRKSGKNLASKRSRRVGSTSKRN